MLSTDLATPLWRNWLARSAVNGVVLIPEGWWFDPTQGR